MAYGVSGACGGTPITWLYTQVDTVQACLADVTRRLTSLEQRVDDLAATPTQPPSQAVESELLLKQGAEVQKQGADIKRLLEALQVLCVSVHQLEAFQMGPPPLRATAGTVARDDRPHRAWDVYSDDECESVSGDAAASGEQSLAFMTAVCRGEEARALLLLNEVGRSPREAPGKHGQHVFSMGELRDARGRSALHLAAARGLLELVRELVHYRPLRDSLDRQQRTPVHHAAARGRAEACAAILDHPEFFHPDNADMDGLTALHCAAAGGHAELCQLLLDHERFTAVHARDCLERTALHHAARQGHAGVCKLLLEHPAFHDEAWAVDCDGRMALHTAASRGFSEVCRVLVQDEGFKERCKSAHDGAAFRSALRQAQGGARAVLEELVTPRAAGAEHSADPEPPERPKSPESPKSRTASRSPSHSPPQLEHGGDTSGSEERRASESSGTPRGKSKWGKRRDQGGGATKEASAPRSAMAHSQSDSGPTKKALSQPEAGHEPEPEGPAMGPLPSDRMGRTPSDKKVVIMVADGHAADVDGPHAHPEGHQQRLASHQDRGGHYGIDPDWRGEGHAGDKPKASLEMVFDSIDRNYDGLISRSEWERFFKGLDLDHDGHVSHAEWCATGAPAIIFEALDTDGDGHVSWTELSRAHSYFDRDGDHKLSIDEFRRRVRQGAAANAKKESLGMVTRAPAARASLRPSQHQPQPRPSQHRPSSAAALAPRPSTRPASHRPSSAVAPAVARRSAAAPPPAEPKSLPGAGAPKARGLWHRGPKEPAAAPV